MGANSVVKNITVALQNLAGDLQADSGTWDKPQRCPCAVSSPRLLQQSAPMSKARKQPKQSGFLLNIHQGSLNTDKLIPMLIHTYSFPNSLLVVFKKYTVQRSSTSFSCSQLQNINLCQSPLYEVYMSRHQDTLIQRHFLSWDTAA